MLDGFLGLIFFTLFALGSATSILKLKKPKQIFISASLISAPWQGGLWLSFIKLDLRLTYIFLFAALSFILSKPPKFSKKYKTTFFISLPTFLLIAWATVSGVQAYDSKLALGGVFVLILNYLFFNTINRSVDNIKDIDYIIKSIFLGLFYTSIIALLQYQIRFFHIGFIDGRFSTFMFWRPRSTFFHANQYGMYQLILLPIVFRQILIVFHNRDKKLMKLYSGLFLLVLLTLFTTSNRGSWVGFAFGMSVVVGMDFFRRGSKKTRKILIRVMSGVGIIILLGAIKYGPRVYDRFVGKGTISAAKQAEHRKQLNVDAYRLLKLYPYKGVGIWNFKYYATVIFTHNLYLLIPSEVGYPGLVFFLWIMFGFFLESRKALKAKNFYISNMGGGFMSTILGLLVASYPGPDFWISYQVSAHLWIVGGIIISLNRMYLQSLKIQKMKRRRRVIKNEKVNPKSYATSYS